ncbi:MAG TPA: pitrilysin family protein [Pirellulales bacterium]|nr:pitrilysin family protein [Pirellulales bacterium]
MEFREHVLPNGLEVVAECNPEARSVALGFFVKAGACDETDDVSGVSHFLEHMVFKGTPKRTADEVNRRFDELGAHYNAFTSEEKTVYHAAVLPEYQRATVELWADLLRPSLRTSDFDTEKKVIIEEIKMYADQPPYGADDRVRASHFGRHPLGRSVLGTVDSITQLSVDAMRSYFQRRYSPANISLVAAGKVDFADLVAAAEEYCGGWQRHETPRLIDPAPAHSSFECIFKDTSSQEYCLQLANGPSATDDDRYPAKLLATVIGDDSGSRLYWELVDPGLAEHASLGHHDHLGTGLFVTYLCCDPEFASENLRRVTEIYRRTENDGITAAELEQAKNKINSRVVLSSERPRGRLFNLGANWIYRHEYRSVKDDLEAIDRITLDEVNAVLSKYPLSKSTTVAIGPLKELNGEAHA